LLEFKLKFWPCFRSTCLGEPSKKDCPPLSHPHICCGSRLFILCISTNYICIAQYNCNLLHFSKEVAHFYLPPKLANVILWDKISEFFFGVFLFVFSLSHTIDLTHWTAHISLTFFHYFLRPNCGT
jgi:hypothetical protein